MKKSAQYFCKRSLASCIPLLENTYLKREFVSLKIKHWSSLYAMCYS